MCDAIGQFLLFISKLFYIYFSLVCLCGHHLYAEVKLVRHIPLLRNYLAAPGSIFFPSSHFKN